MEARSGVGNLEYSTDREESKNFKLSIGHILPGLLKKKKKIIFLLFSKLFSPPGHIMK